MMAKAKATIPQLSVIAPRLLEYRHALVMRAGSRWGTVKDGRLLTLPIGVQTFEIIRRMGHLYVDKTARLQELAMTSGRCFLARPRRFGKSLTLSTLDAMFSGRVELFEGLAAEEWVAEQAEHPSPVLRFDMGGLRAYPSAEMLDLSISSGLEDFADRHGLRLRHESSCGGMLIQTIHALYDRAGPVVVLIDEYDKPILDHIGDPEAAGAMRAVLRSFYTVLKSCDEYIRFVMLTGISKFTKTGVFSAMNNLNDISMDEAYGDIVGYTQQELEERFSDRIDITSEKMGLSREELLAQMKAHYDGFCFDGVTKLYNPYSILNFFFKSEFADHWYSSGSPSFIAEYMKRHSIQDPAAYRHIEVDRGFAESQEIERARPESFLFQAGYLTIEAELPRQVLRLDYPNREVEGALVRMYLEQVYRVEGYITLGTRLWEALRDAAVDEVVRIYNMALSGIPYDDLPSPSEALYRSLFLMLLRGAGVEAYGEVHTIVGRSDVLIRFAEHAIVLEFKFAKKSADVDKLREEGMRQIEERRYAEPFEGGPIEAVSAVIVIDGMERRAVL